MISTYTIIAGNMNCPNNCPICISKMTPNYGIGWDKCEFNWRKFSDATRIAILRGARNVLITGKGEPTLFPLQLEQIIDEIPYKAFERIELQTEGSHMANNIPNDVLENWYFAGLDLVAISIYHYVDTINAVGFGKKETVYNLAQLIDDLNKIGYLVRLSCVMLQGFVDTPTEVDELVKFCKAHDVFQLTLRTADFPEKPVNQEMAEYVKLNRLTKTDIQAIEFYLNAHGKQCGTLPHGADIYEVNGQNVCIATGLGQEENRQLIFFPQGWLTTSWEAVQGGRII